MTMKFSAPCIFGLEGLCANELRYLGVENVNAENGRVTDRKSTRLNSSHRL